MQYWLWHRRGGNGGLWLSGAMARPHAIARPLDFCHTPGFLLRPWSPDDHRCRCSWAPFWLLGKRLIGGVPDAVVLILASAAAGGYVSWPPAFAQGSVWPPHFHALPAATCSRARLSGGISVKRKLKLAAGSPLTMA